MKFGDDNAMVWAYFWRNGSGTLMKIKETMKSLLYRDILQTYTLSFVNERMPTKCSFQHENDSKHSSKLIKTKIFFQTKY